MNYIIFDLEWNRYAKKVKIKCPDEIIQIGAVKYDADFNYLGSFNALIRPSLYSKIEPMVQGITGININLLKEKGIPFSKAFKSFREFMGKDFVLMSWGAQDVAILRENCIYYNKDISLNWLGKFVDLQKYASEHKLFKTETNQLGLKSAVEALGISYNEKELHDALVDATLSGEVFEKVFEKEKFQKHIIDGRKIHSHYKGIHITDLKSTAINKREFLVKCPKCGRFLTKTAGWYKKDKGFCAIHKCKKCKNETYTFMDVYLMLDDSIKYKKRTTIVEKIEL